MKMSVAIASFLIIAAAVFVSLPKGLPAASGQQGASSQSDAQTEGSEKGASTLEKATFGAGCFWGVEASFREVKGVKGTAVGYSGGHLANPTYEQVCTGGTGHAEVVLVEFDPEEVSYDQLLEVFWKIHNPTTLNRQGPDVGTQYRSAIFYHNDEQKRMAEQSKARQQNSGRFNRPIVTQIEKASEFWRAEEYHQQYLEKRGLLRCH